MRFGNSFGIRSNFAKLYWLSWKWKDEYFGTFLYRPSLSTGVPFRKAKNVPKIFAKQTNENVRNPCQFIFGIPENFGNFAKVQKFRSKTRKFWKWTLCMTDVAYVTNIALFGKNILKNLISCFSQPLCVLEQFWAYFWIRLTRLTQVSVIYAMSVMFFFGRILSIFESSGMCSTFLTYSKNSGIFSDSGFEPYFRENFW